MSLTRHIAQKINGIVNNFNSVVEEIIKRSLGQNGFSPVLVDAFDTNPLKNSESSIFDVKNIFDNSIVLYCPVPKKRVTAEHKLKEKFLRLPHTGMTKYCTPKTNIITCQDCGGYHEIGTICGDCYAKVKAETKAIQEQMFKDDQFRYQYPAKEVAFVYEGEENLKEEVKKQKNKVIVDLPRKRPSWFSDNLLTKISSLK